MLKRHNAPTRLEVQLQPDENRLLDQLSQHLATKFALRMTKAGTLRYAMMILAEQEHITP